MRVRLSERAGTRVGDINLSSTLIKIQNQVKESLTPKTQTVKVDESQTVRESWHARVGADQTRARLSYSPLALIGAYHLMSQNKTVLK
jgi:hypothetical protein